LGAELHLASIVTESSQAVIQAISIRNQLQKVGEQATATAKDSLKFAEKTE